MTMKKALKISTYCLLVSIIVAIGLCYIIIPERTKWAFDIVVDYLNKPLGVAFGTTITLGLVIGVVLKLVWDRHKDSIKQIIITKRINKACAETISTTNSINNMN